MKLFRYLVLIAAVLLVAKPVQASSITVLVGDKDWFGTSLPGKAPGNPGPWSDTALFDMRSGTEPTATNGEQLTDLYSAIYFTNTYPCSPPDVGPWCSPNKDTGTVILPFSGTLQSGTLTILRGGFQCALWGAMVVDVNGVNLPSCFEDSPQGTALWSFALTPQMIAAANLAGQVTLTFDHSQVTCDGNGDNCKGLDYIAFDYFEMHAEVAPVPEPATFVLLGLGLAGLAARRRWRR